MSTFGAIYLGFFLGVIFTTLLFTAVLAWLGRK